MISHYGDPREFYYKRQQYIGIARFYLDGTYDVEVTLVNDEEADVNEDVFEHAFDLFEELGLFNKQGERE